MKKEGHEEINAIVNKAKEEVRQGVKEKKLTITDISQKMTKAMNEIRASFLEEIEEVIQEEHDTEATSCPECGNPLKKTEK
ncbi:MAG: hypothetical protein FWG40_08065 [Peptococcaceae bacterium]|jgi:uncharacterized protein with PIN domain|nr:hypothetical protein [Peptococcaceae bacterium]